MMENSIAGKMNGKSILLNFNISLNENFLSGDLVSAICKLGLVAPVSSSAETVCMILQHYVPGYGNYVATHRDILIMRIVSCLLRHHKDL